MKENRGTVSLISSLFGVQDNTKRVSSHKYVFMDPCISGAVKVEELSEMEEEASEVAAGGVKVADEISFIFQVFEDFMENFCFMHANSSEVFQEVFHLMHANSSEVFQEVFHLMHAKSFEVFQEVFSSIQDS
ncbi:unnamed protein product [Brassica rapa]|uniref:Uncharacterized protein n=2 Tax=Brassica TaxID=3705 RepID=A0A8D9M4Q3_BRACM|nr:unnamed protein product [Brassica napus]CAG7897552.1 unnamed protein product [Brassica rapa]